MMSRTPAVWFLLCVLPLTVTIGLESGRRRFLNPKKQSSEITDKKLPFFQTRNIDTQGIGSREKDRVFFGGSETYLLPISHRAGILDSRDKDGDKYLVRPYHRGSSKILGHVQQVVTIQSRHEGCEYEGKHYRPGQRFRPDPCTFCKCPRRGGLAACIISDCQWEPNCLRVDNSSRRCCPKCLEYGCLHVDGKLYPRGSVVSESICGHCACPWNGGYTECDYVKCDKPRCVDPVQSTGQCCPVCPNGPNCQHGLVTIPVSTVKNIDGLLCRCRPMMVHGQVQLRAVCTKELHS